jgi:hypothetical protein
MGLQRRERDLPGRGLSRGCGDKMASQKRRKGKNMWRQ